MIPCHICGKDASTGWIRGLPPAPDSQKLALCSAHDTPQNRKAVDSAWQAMLEGRIESVSSTAKNTTAHELKVVTVRFSGGGMLSFTGSDCRTTGHGTLCIEEPDGSQTFIPMQHVRDYHVSPVITGKISESE